MLSDAGAKEHLRLKHHRAMLNAAEAQHSAHHGFRLQVGQYEWV